MELERIRGSWNYHWWGNRKLFDIVSGLGEDTAARALGTQFSFPSLKGMLAHIHGADRIWLERWMGKKPVKLLGDGDFASLADLRKRWDDLEAEQHDFVDALTPSELQRVVVHTGLDGKVTFRQPLWELVQHVVNHATHHRSELATMITMVKGSPPSTDMIIYYRIASGQLQP